MGCQINTVTGAILLDKQLLPDRVCQGSLHLSMRRSLQALLLCSWFAPIAPLFAQTWTQTSAPITNWSSIAMSADGTKLVAVVGGGSAGSPGSAGPIYTSTDSGTTWISNNAPIMSWMGVCSSADGTKLAANEYHGGSWTNSGTTWKQTSASGSSGFYSPSSIASTPDGNILIASSSGNSLLYMSTNRGKVWTSPYVAFEGCALSGDGTRILVVPGNPYISINSGATWVLGTNVQTELRAAAMSVDGMKLFAMGQGGVLVSTNGGAFWFWSGAPTSGYGSIASSADGTHLILARNFPSSALYVSADSGFTWTAASAPSNYWSAVASSADGSTVAAAMSGGGIWIGKSVPTPQLNIKPTSNQVRLSWTVPSSNFIVQSSQDLSKWTSLTNKPILNPTNLQNQLSLPPTNGSAFYRLTTP